MTGRRSHGRLSALNGVVHQGKANPKIVRAYVKRLRHQLGDDAARPAWIVNERGVGYRMARPGEAGEP